VYSSSPASWDTLCHTASRCRQRQSVNRPRERTRSPPHSSLTRAEIPLCFAHVTRTPIGYRILSPLKREASTPLLHPGSQLTPGFPWVAFAWQPPISARPLPQFGASAEVINAPVESARCLTVPAATNRQETWLLMIDRSKRAIVPYLMTNLDGLAYFLHLPCECETAIGCDGAPDFDKHDATPINAPLSTL